MAAGLWFATHVECLPVVYGLVTRSWILSGDPGNERIQEIAMPFNRELRHISPGSIG